MSVPSITAVSVVGTTTGSGSGSGGCGHLCQGGGQLIRVVGSEELPAGFDCDALHLRQSLGVRANVETDHMGGEINAGLFQQACGCAGIGIAGLNPVTDKDDGRLFLGVAQGLRGGDDCVGHGRLAQRFDPVHSSRNLGRRSRCRGDDRFDIRAFAAFAVAIDRQAKPLFCWEIRQKLAHDVLRDGDLGNAIDLSPH